MKILNRSFDTPQENLSCDEALLEHCERTQGPEVLRFWESPRHFIVLGYSNAWKDEVLTNGTGRAHFPVLRRASGGGTVLQGPGCFNYSLILRSGSGGPLSTNRLVMERHRKALGGLLDRRVEVRGSTDLTLDGLKFSGNSQRRKKTYLLFHGTFLLDFDLSLVEKCLKMPPKQPAYRENRPHRLFLTNLNVPKKEVLRVLSKAWNAAGAAALPQEEVTRLARGKYASEQWNLLR